MASKIQVNGINIHYQQRGRGPEVVLIHGITSSLAMWYNQILQSLSQHAHVTAYDLRGHGLSDITETGYTSRAMAEDLLGVLDHLKLDKVTLVGHSFGGTVSLHFAQLHPDRVNGIVMLDSGVACLRYLRIIQDWIGWSKRPDDLAKNGLSLAQFMELDSKQDVTEIIRHGLSVPRRGGFRKGENALTPRMEKLLATKMGLEFRDVAGLTEDLFPSIQTPVLCAYGETSPYKKMSLHLAAALPNCHAEVLAGAGHFYTVLRPQIVTDLLNEFVADPEGFVQRKKDAAAEVLETVNTGTGD